MASPGWSDPYNIVPDSFKERFSGCDTVEEALEIAARRHSTTEDGERERCPYCLSIQVSSKPNKRRSPQQKPGKYRCRHQGCRCHFDQTADETTIAMTDDRADAFDWIVPENLADPEERGFSPLFDGLDEMVRVELALRLYRPWSDDGPAYRTLAELFPNSHEWIGSRVRAWKDGEYRDLVEDPRATVDSDSGDDAIAADGGVESRRWAAYGGRSC